MESALTLLLVALGGAAIGALVAWLIATRQIAALTTRAVTAEAKLSATEQGEQRLREAFDSLSHKALLDNSETFANRAQRDLDGLIAPLSAALAEQQRKIEDLERERQKAYGSIEEQLKRMTTDQRQLQSETAKLVNSLRQPQVRGRWGEIQLRRVVETAGMSQLCDFVEQESFTDGQGARQRPDMQVRLPNQRVIVVDAKVPLSAYLLAEECSDDSERKVQLQQHARQVRDHINEMCKRDYQDGIDGAYDFLVLFIPGEVFYRAALEHDTELLDFAFKKNVILATPSTLIALLKAVALGWREARLSEDAHKIKKEGEAIYKALATLAGYVADTGKAIERSVVAYNKLVGSMDTTLFNSARRMRELDISDSVINAPAPLDQQLRSFRRPELLQGPPEDGAP